MEMTGLDPERDRILEAACVLTDSQLTLLAEGPVLTIHHSDIVLAAMDDWNKQTHTQSGLINKVRKSTLSVADAERKLLQFLSEWIPPQEALLCGNSVHQDRRFIHRYMPSLDYFLHYRHLDVSSIRELLLRWRPDLSAGFSKQHRHEALADIHESIAELQYYKDHFFMLSDARRGT